MIKEEIALFGPQPGASKHPIAEQWRQVIDEEIAAEKLVAENYF